MQDWNALFIYVYKYICACVNANVYYRGRVEKVNVCLCIESRRRRRIVKEEKLLSREKIVLEINEANGAGKQPRT